MREFFQRYDAWLRRGAVVIVLAISWQVLPDVQREVVGLHRFALKQLRKRSFVASELATPRGGESRALSGRTVALLSLLRAHQPESFRCSRALTDSAYDFQRIVESAWPIRYDENSRVELSLLAESTPCEVLGEQRLRSKKTAQEHGVRIALCP